MAETIKVSVVIPTYNRATLIGKTLDTFTQQVAQNFEVIIVDDGSADNTADVVRPYLNDARFSYHQVKNGERGAARNFGARLAKGSYVNFFDSDDLAHPNHIQVAGESIGKLNYPEVFHLAYDILQPISGQRTAVNNMPALINDELVNGNHLSCNGVFVRKDIAATHNFCENRNLSASEDYELWLRLAARFPLHCINTVTSTVVNHEERSVLKIQHDKFLKRMEMLRANLEADQEVQKKFGLRWSEFIAFQSIYIALHLAMAKSSLRQSFYFLFKAIRQKPSVIFTRRFLAALKVTIFSII